MDTTMSSDGTLIAYDRTGEGPALILVTGALGDRADVAPLAAALARTSPSLPTTAAGAEGAATRSRMPSTARSTILRR